MPVWNGQGSGCRSEGDRLEARSAGVELRAAAGVELRTAAGSSRRLIPQGCVGLIPQAQRANCVSFFSACRSSASAISLSISVG